MTLGAVRISGRRGELGELTVMAPPDKAICQRALVTAALADGTGTIRPWIDNRDTRALVRAVERLGVSTTRRGDKVVVGGGGRHAFAGRNTVADVDNSATAARLLLAVAAGQPRSVITVTGNAALRRRPMWWLAEPLRAMGARLHAAGDGQLPLRVHGRHPLRAVEVTPAVHSAQAKSALLFAALFADGPSRIGEQTPARDHTQRLLRAHGVIIETDPHGATTLVPPQRLAPLHVTVPGDISAVAPLIAATAGRPEPGTALHVHGVGLNPTRTGFLRALADMGADLRVEEEDQIGGEPIGLVTVHSGALLQGISLAGHALLQSMIDEVTLLGVLAAVAKGDTVVRDAAEMRDKDTDRLGGTIAFLRGIGVPVEALPDGFVVHGPSVLAGGSVDVGADHRLVMAAAVAASLAAEPVRLAHGGIVGVSNSRFFADLAPFAVVDEEPP